MRTWIGLAALSLLSACASTTPVAPAQWSRIDRTPINQREFQADRAICASAALARAGYMAAQVDFSPLAGVGESLGAGIAGARARADADEAAQIHYRACMAQRGYVLPE